MLTESELRQAEVRIAVLYENVPVDELDVVYTLRGILAGIRFALESDPTGNGLLVRSLIERGAAAAQTWAELG